MYIKLYATQGIGERRHRLGPMGGPQHCQPSPAHLWFYLLSAQVMTASAPTPTRGLGALPLPAGRAPPLCFSALPAIWATPSFWLLQCAKCSSAHPLSARGSPRPKHGAQATRGFRGQSTDPRNAFCLDHPLHQEMGLIQSSCQNPDLQEPGQPSRPLPHQLGTSCYQLHHYCTCPICAGGRGCLFNKPQPTSWASPRERSLWPTPRPGTLPATPAHSTLCPP